MKVNDADRQVWTDAYQIFAKWYGAEDCQKTWKDAYADITQAYQKHGKSQYSQQIFGAVLGALQERVVKNEQ